MDRRAIRARDRRESTARAVRERDAGLRLEEHRTVGLDPEPGAHSLRVERLPRNAARVERVLGRLAELEQPGVLDQLLAGLLLERPPAAMRVLCELHPLRVGILEP